MLLFCCVVKLALPKLTRRAKELLIFILEEITTQNIVDKFCISVNTVETHRTIFLSKSGAKNVGDIALLGFIGLNKAVII